jgi:hypothetical protein
MLIIGLNAEDQLPADATALKASWPQLEVWPNL